MTRSPQGSLPPALAGLLDPATYEHGPAAVELRETHISIQYRVVFENLDEIAAAMVAFTEGRLAPIDTSGRESRTWGQPRLSDWLRWKRDIRRQARAAPSPHEGRAG